MPQILGFGVSVRAPLAADWVGVVYRKLLGLAYRLRPRPRPAAAPPRPRPLPQAQGTRGLANSLLNPMHFTFMLQLVTAIITLQNSNLQIEGILEGKFEGSRNQSIRRNVSFELPSLRRRSNVYSKEKILRFDGFYKPSIIRRIFPSIRRFEFCSEEVVLQ